MELVKFSKPTQCLFFYDWDIGWYCFLGSMIWGLLPHPRMALITDNDRMGFLRENKSGNFQILNFFSSICTIRCDIREIKLLKIIINHLIWKHPWQVTKVNYLKLRSLINLWRVSQKPLLNLVNKIHRKHGNSWKNFKCLFIIGFLCWSRKTQILEPQWRF